MKSLWLYGEPFFSVLSMNALCSMWLQWIAPHTHHTHQNLLLLKITKSTEWLTRRKSCDLRFIAWFVCAFPLCNFDGARIGEKEKKNLAIFVSLLGVVAKRWDVATAGITDNDDWRTRCYLFINTLYCTLSRERYLPSVSIRTGITNFRMANGRLKATLQFA